MNRLFSLAALAVVAASGPALAADPIMPAPAPIVDSSAFDWSGFYAGLNVGYGWGEVADDDGNVYGTYDSAEGFVAGGQLGYNHQIDMFVLGIEGDIQLTGVEDQNTAGDFPIGLDYFGTLRGRAGVALDNFVPYVTGGLAYGEITGTDENTGQTESNFHWGWTVGAGVDYAFSDSVSIRAEYLYTDLRAEEAFYTGPDGIAIDFHTVRAGVNFHF